MIYYTSDTHFFHANIVQYCGRPYIDAVKMNEALCDNWAARVLPNDTIFHLGDVGLASKNKLLTLLKKLPGNKHLILGNHDIWIPELRYIFKWTKRYHEIYGLLGQEWWQPAHEKEERANHKLPVVLCHYPMAEWNQSHRGSWMLHGHSHGNLTSNRRRYDVGVDCNSYHPISFEELIPIMRQRNVTKHHEEK